MRRMRTVFFPCLIGTAILVAAGPLLARNDDGDGVDPAQIGDDEEFFYDLKGAERLFVDLQPLASTSRFRSSLGYYLVDENGRPYRGRVIWKDVTRADRKSMTISRRSLGKATGMGFFLIPDGASLNPRLGDGDLVGLAEYAGEWTVVLDGRSLNGASLPAFLSESRWNADGLDHVSDSAAPGDMNWEESYGGGDRSFDDVNIEMSLTVEYRTAKILAVPAPSPEAETVQPPAKPAEDLIPESGADPQDELTGERSSASETSSVEDDADVEPAPIETEVTTEALEADAEPAVPARPFWGSPDFSGFGEVEVSVFPEEPQFDRQSDERVQQSVAGSLTYVQDAGDDGETFLELFGRYDQIDDERSYIDIQKAHVAYFGDVVSVRAGVLNETWGVLERENIVDIVNQRNIVEDFKADAKLGQPGIKASLPLLAFGQADVYYLPYPRRRPFPEEDGRFQVVLPIDDDDAFYESAADGASERWGEQAAARAQFLIGDLEAAVSHFYGTSRDPGFDVVLDGAVPLALTPTYDQINQTAVELRAIAFNNVLKAEAFRRTGDDPFDDEDAIYGVAGGIERDFVRIFDSDVGLTLFGEYYYDNRSSADPVAPAPLDNDIFVGGRFVFNDLADTQLLVGGTIDLDSQATLMSMELKRRLGDNLQLILEGDAFVNGDDDPLQTAFQNDHRILARFRYYY